MPLVTPDAAHDSDLQFIGEPAGILNVDVFLPGRCEPFDLIAFSSIGDDSRCIFPLSI